MEIFCNQPHLFLAGSPMGTATRRMFPFPPAGNSPKRSTKPFPNTTSPGCAPAGSVASLDKEASKVELFGRVARRADGVLLGRWMRQMDRKALALAPVSVTKNVKVSLCPCQASCRVWSC